MTKIAFMDDHSEPSLDKRGLKLISKKGRIFIDVFISKTINAIKEFGESKQRFTRICAFFFKITTKHQFGTLF